MERENFDIQAPDELIRFIESWLPKTGFGYYSNFYIGITDDIERSLLDDHGINPDEDMWLYSDMNTSADAEKVLKYFLSKGMQGVSTPVSAGAISVYCYVMTDATVQ